MIRWTNNDKAMLDHVVEVINDRMCEADGYNDDDRATMAKLDELAKAGPALTVTGEQRDHPTELSLFEQIVTAELDNWVPGASQRLLYRSSRALGVGGLPDPAYAARQDCGPEPGSHALGPDWIAGVYVYQCASCFRLYRA